MSKRTLDSFFAPKVKKQKVEGSGAVLALDPSTDSPYGPPSNHVTYPFPILQLPKRINAELQKEHKAQQSSSSKEAKEIKNQPDLDLLYFEPYIQPSIAKELFEFLRTQLFFYRVQYKIKRGGREMDVSTPRL
jgi:hypothetical protein